MNVCGVTCSTLCRRFLCASGKVDLVFSHLSNYQSPPLYVASSSKGSHMTRLSSSLVFFDVQKRRVGLVKEVQGGTVGWGW